MKNIEKHKNILLIVVLAIISIVFCVHIFFLGKPFDKILSNIIGILSFLTILLVIYPNKKNIKKLSNYKDNILIMTFLIIIEIVFALINNLNIKYVFLFSIFLSSFITSFISLLLPYKLKRIYMYFILIFSPIYLIIQDIYFFVFGDFFSVIEAETFREKNGFVETTQGFFHLKIIYLFYIFLAILAIILLSDIKNKIKYKFNYKKLIIPFIFFILIIFNAGYPVKQARLYTSDYYLYKTIYSNTRFVSRFGVTNYLFRDIVQSVTRNFRSNNIYNNEIKEYFKENKKIHSNNEYTGIFKDKNLIFIMAESLDYIALSEELTPNIVNLARNGMFFNNYYAPVYPRTTCDNEIILNTGLIPSVTDGTTCYTFNKNTFSNSLANLFNNKGYITNAFHNNNKEFYTRNLLYKGYGYNKFYGQDELGLTNITKRYDSVFFEKAKDYIISEDKFMSFIITLSGHSPYNFDNIAVKKHFKTVKNEYKNIDDELISYMSAQMELDIFVKLLINELKNRDILDDTVIILTADHYPYTINKNIFNSYTGIKDKYLKSKVPLIIWSNNIKPQVIDKISASFDILPTIANLFDLPIDYTYYFGNDILSDDYKSLVYYKDYSWYDGDNYVLFGDKIIGNGEKSYIKSITNKVNKYFDISIKILRSNYFKKP